MSYKEAFALAEQVSAELTPLVAKLKCVGSLRRRRKRIGDIEFLAMPHFDVDLLGHQTPIIDPLRRAMTEMGTWIKGGERMMQVTDLFGNAGARLELYLVHPPASWGSLLAIRTGPAELGRYVMTVCREHGVKHKDGYARRLAGGELVPTETEEEFFALAKVDCLPPMLRDAQAKNLWEQRERNRPSIPARRRW